MLNETPLKKSQISLLRRRFDFAFEGSFWQFLCFNLPNLKNYIFTPKTPKIKPIYLVNPHPPIYWLFQDLLMDLPQLNDISLWIPLMEDQVHHQPQVLSDSVPSLQWVVECCSVCLIMCRCIDYKYSVY